MERRSGRLRDGRFSAALLAASVAGCSPAGETNFSQYPGFAAYFAANPRTVAVPSASDRTLLERYRPRLYIVDGAPSPIRFYEDYVAQGRLIDRDGAVISTAVSPALLNRYRDNPHVVFKHEPTGAATRSVMYGRADRETFDMAGISRRFTFLTWTAVFRVSGVGAGISGWKGALLGLAGDLDDWHQLDHYTSVTLALDERERPVAAMFQQHNYRQTRAIGTDMPWPPDDRIRVDVARRSNEFYPHRPERAVRRAAGFLSASTVEYVVTGRNEPFRSADDVTGPGTEVGYTLDFLPPSDAFYSFAGFLGEKRLLPGRSGPPGADYNTVPSLKPLHRQMIAFHWREGDGDYVAWFDQDARGRAKLAERFAHLVASR